MGVDEEKKKDFGEGWTQKKLGIIFFSSLVVEKFFFNSLITFLFKRMGCPFWIF